MVHLLFTLLLFLATVVLHVLVHRGLARVGKNTFKSVVVIPAGFIVSSLIIFFYLSTIPAEGANWWVVPLPLNSILLYAILSIIYGIYFSNSYYGEDSPSGKIYSILNKKGAATLKEIEAQFSDKEVIIKRLDNLVGADLVEKKGTTYYSRPRAEIIVNIFDFYREILGWDKGG